MTSERRVNTLIAVVADQCSQVLIDRRSPGWQVVCHGLMVPNLFASLGILLVHCGSIFIGEPFALEAYVAGAVITGAASNLMVLPLRRVVLLDDDAEVSEAASLALSVGYNFTLGIAVYLLLAATILKYLPVEAFGDG